MCTLCILNDMHLLIEVKNQRHLPTTKLSSIPAIVVNRVLFKKKINEINIIMELNIRFQTTIWPYSSYRIIEVGFGAQKALEKGTVHQSFL